jgi:hypothetical protein
MASVQFIVHNESQILLIDFSNAKTIAEITQIAEEAKKIVAIHRPKSLLVLVDFTDVKMNGERIKIIRDMAAHNRQYVRFIAIVGLGFFMSAAFRMMLRVTGRKNHMVFRTREKALEWLAEK